MSYPHEGRRLGLRYRPEIFGSHVGEVENLLLRMVLTAVGALAKALEPVDDATRLQHSIKGRAQQRAMLQQLTVYGANVSYRVLQNPRRIVYAIFD